MTATCSSCGAGIIWCFTEGGRRMPVDAEPVEGGNITLSPASSPGDAPTAVVSGRRAQAADLFGDDSPRYTSHFATCPHADAHRRSR